MGSARHTPMPRKKFLVERLGGQWKITADRASFGLFDDKHQAVTYAIEAANRAGPAHRQGSQVLVQRRDGTYRIAWTFGLSPYPMEYRDPEVRWLRQSSQGEGSKPSGKQSDI